jgi:flagellar biosynthesis protein FliR
VHWLQQLSYDKFLLFTLVLTRVSGLTMTAPIYGTSDIPAQVRALLAVALALLITPTQWHVAVSQPPTVLMYLVLIGSELLIGLCLGLGIMVLFSGAQLAGEMISYVSGMMLGDVYDPGSQSEVPIFSRLLQLVALAVFVCIGGHRVVMAGMLDTFASIPPGSGVIPNTISEAFVVLVTQSFHLAIRASIPVVTALLLSTLVMGLISRTLPQLNVLMIGFGLSSILALGVLALTIGAAAWAFQDQVAPALSTVLEALQAPLRTDLLP